MSDQKINQHPTSKIFERGQVWFWDDPVFGRKPPNAKFQIGEAPYRYSRYVVIVQTQETIDSCNVLVVPCSTGNHTPHDVPIPLKHIYHDQISYAKCRAIMPVHPKLLGKYVCTLPDEILKQIDAEIIKLLCPYITNVFSKDDIKDWFGIDMEAEHKSPIEEKDTKDLEDWVNAFVKKKLYITGNICDRVGVRTMKDAYDAFCINSNTIPVTRDTFRFMDVLVKLFNNMGVMHISNWADLNYEITTIQDFVGVKLKEDALRVSCTLSGPASTPNKNATSFSSNVMKGIVDASTPVKNDWKNENHVRKFVTSYENDGIEVCAKNFNLGQNTAKRYYSKFVAAGYTALPKETKLPTAKDSPKSVSKIANLIRDYLKDLKTYRSTKNVPMAEDEYYAKIQSACYFSLLEFVGIRTNGSKRYIPTLSASTEHLDTWRFLDAIYHDMRISMEKDPVQVMNLGRLHYGDTFGISQDWLQMITRRLQRMGLNDAQVAAVIAPITDMFCARK